jgi:hypothetical protein
MGPDQEQLMATGVYKQRLSNAMIPALLCLGLILAGCASTPDPVRSIPEGDFRERIVTQEEDQVRVSAGVPSASETRKLFGKDLYKQGIQPVWLEIENFRDQAVTFLPVGLDPAYYTALEAANAGLRVNEQDAVNLIDDFFLEQDMVLNVPPAQTRSGFIFTRLDEGTKAFNVDISGGERFVTFTFFVPVPGLNIDHYNVDFAGMYADEQWLDLSTEELIRRLEEFPCCVTNADGSETGDPLNLVIIGHPRDVYTAFIRAGWDETESVTRASAWKTMKSFMSGGEYRYSPVSSLYVFGRPQDVAFQKARENIHERNHLRLWMSPGRYQGIPVWIGQISRDIGVRFTTKTITTHKIDPNVDETREYLLEDLAYAQSLQAIGYIGGVGEVPMDQPRGNLTGDPWFTDGNRVVLWITSQPTDISEIRGLSWRDIYGDGTFSK